VDHFLSQAAEQLGTPRKRIHPEALEVLARRDWSENNARELRNVVDLAVDFCPDEEVSPAVIQRVFRVQRGEMEAPPDAAPSTSGRAVPSAGSGMVLLESQQFREILRQMQEDVEVPKEATPYYRVQLEASARAILEGLRTTAWKVRPAARILGISPTKLRGDLKEFIGQVVARCDRDLERAASLLDIPIDVLEKKASDLGIEGILKETRS
jgi:DNA-binding NtrC family response regulator